MYGKIQEIESSSKKANLEAVMSDIVDIYVCISDAMGPAKSNQQIERSMQIKTARKRATSQ
jgi:hypothetical protein